MPKITAIKEKGILTLSEKAWEQAKLRHEVISLLSQDRVVGTRAADDAAEKLGLSRRQIYKLVHRYRDGGDLVTDMSVSSPTGGRGKKRLCDDVEKVIQSVIRKDYLNRQKIPQSSILRKVLYDCHELGLKGPSLNTISSRIKRLDPLTTATAREGLSATRKLRPIKENGSRVKSVLEQVQIDHTIVDLIIVDEISRQPIGRPYLTVAIDVYSRCIVGMVITLEAPSATSVGLCLCHIVCDKRPWVERLGLDISWPMSGKPESLYVDNAAEFKSEALQRGCTQHGIGLYYRPPGQPHYGGIVERVIGTAMQRIHELPGTTFSNPHQKGEYDSEQRATLTLKELERWLTVAIASYHASFHSTLKQPPAIRWAEGISHRNQAYIVTSPQAFIVDFLPVLRRSISRNGFLIDHIFYYADSLKPWIYRSQHLDKFVIRRDPRDISRVWVLDPEGKCYLEIPYRTLSNPAITLWEHKKAMEKLKEQGKSSVNEGGLFRMVTQMREIIKTAKSTTRKTRREEQRRAHLLDKKSKINPIRYVLPKTIPDEHHPAQPFEQIEEW